MEQKCSLPYSQESATCPHLQPEELSLPPLMYFLIDFNIIPSTPMSIKWSLPFRLSDQMIAKTIRNCLNNEVNEKKSDKQKLILLWNQEIKKLY
jgi:hypothetical protein